MKGNQVKDTNETQNQDDNTNKKTRKTQFQRTNLDDAQNRKIILSNLPNQMNLPIQKEQIQTLKSENDELISPQKQNTNSIAQNKNKNIQETEELQQQNKKIYDEHILLTKKQTINLQQEKLQQSESPYLQPEQTKKKVKIKTNSDSSSESDENEKNLINKSNVIKQLEKQKRQSIIENQQTLQRYQQDLKQFGQQKIFQRLTIIDKTRKARRNQTKKQEKFDFFADYMQLTGENNDPSQSRTEDGKLTKFYNVRLMYLEYSLLFFCLTNIAFSIIYYDSDFKTLDPTVVYNNTRVTNTCLWVTFLSSICLIVVTYYRYLAVLDLEICQKIYHDTDNLRSSGKIPSFLLETILIILQPYPFSNEITFTTYDYVDQLEFEFKINYLFCLTCLIKSFIIIRVLLKRSIFINTRAYRLTKMYGCESNYQYAIKCLFNDYPLPIIGIVFSISVIVCAFGLRICERPLTNLINLQGKGNNSQDFEYFENSIWCVIITMTTVGYGDYYPRTLLGRIWNIFIAIWGIFIVSMMILTLTNMLNLDTSEKKALTVLNRLETRSDLRKKAAQLIAMYYYYKYVEHSYQKEGKIPPQNHFKEKAVILKRYTDYFKDCNRLMKNLYDKDNIYEEMSRQFDFIREDIKNLNQNQEGLTQLIEDNFAIQFSKTDL